MRLLLLGLLADSVSSLLPGRNSFGSKKQRNVPPSTETMPLRMGASLQETRSGDEIGYRPTTPVVASGWRPAALPRLTRENIGALKRGETVEGQQRSGAHGGGFLVQDVRGTPEAVWSLLTDYERYDQIIGTVRSSSVRAGSTPQCARATFTLSKFLLEVSVLHIFDEPRQMLKFSLDAASTNYILKEAEGLWFIDTAADGLKPGHVRVWFQASVRVSRLVPASIVDYAANRALRRATSWLPDAVAAAPLTLAAQTTPGIDGSSAV